MGNMSVEVAMVNVTLGIAIILAAAVGRMIDQGTAQ